MWWVLSWAALGAAVGTRGAARASGLIRRTQSDGRAFANGRLHTTAWYTVAFASVTAALFAGVAARFDGVFSLLAYSVFVSALVTHTFVDIDTHLLVRSVTTRATVIGVPLLFVAAPSRVFASAVGALAMWGVLRLLLAFSRGGLGRGDVALAPFLGWFLAAISIPHVFVALVVSFVVAGVVVGLALVFRRVHRSTHVPFGPFLAIGSVTTVFVGSHIVEWWLG